MNKSLILPIIALFILIVPITAFEFDNIKRTKDIGEKYPEITIENAFGLGDKLWVGRLAENTDICGEECYAIKEIQLLKDGPLVNDIKFLGLDGKNKKIRDYKFYVETVNELVLVNDSELRCNKNENGTDTCKSVIIGSHFEFITRWNRYNLGDNMPAGNYRIKLVGWKKSTLAVDWIISTQGEWLDEWAVWGSIAGGDDAEVLLLLPLNNSGLSGAVNFNCSANTTVSGLANITFWHNQTGTMHLNQSNTANFNNLSANINQTHGNILTQTNSETTTWSNLTVRGQAVMVSIINISVKASTGTMRVSIHDSASKNSGPIIGNTTVSNNVAVFPEPIFLRANGNYWINFSCPALCIQAYDDGLSVPSIQPYIIFGEDGGTPGRYWNTEKIEVAPINFVESNFSTTITEDLSWNCESCNNDGDCGFATSNYSLRFGIFPPLVSITNPGTSIDYGFVTDTFNLNWTVSDDDLDSCWYEYEAVNTTVTCSNNGTVVPINAFINRTITVYANDSVGNINSSSVTWTYKIFQEIVDYNLTTFETKDEGFRINITADGTETVTASLNLNNTLFPSTKTGNDEFMIFTNTLDIPLGVENKSVAWNITHGSTIIETNQTNQTVQLANFSICGASNLVPYINFSYQNETVAQEDTTAFVPTSTFAYYLGAGTINKSLSYSDGTELSNHTFCFSPADETVSVDLTYTYDNSESQQRVFDPNTLSLTNTTTQQTLFLLPTSSGIFVTFQVINAAEQPLSDVLINITRSGFGTIASEITGPSGSISVFLNPNVVYTVTASRSGFATFSATQSFPNTEFTISLGPTTVTGNDYIRGISLAIFPKSQVLNNATNVEFNYTINSTFWNLDEWGYRIKNRTTELAINSSTAATGGQLRTLLNTGNHTLITMEYYWVINSTYHNRTISWAVAPVGTGSIKGFVDRLKTYIEDGIFGLNDFGTAIILFVIIFTFTGVLSFSFGLNSPKAIFFVATVLVLFFDIINILPNPTGVRFLPSVLMILIMGVVVFGGER